MYLYQLKIEFKRDKLYYADQQLIYYVLHYCSTASTFGFHHGCEHFATTLGFYFTYPLLVKLNDQVLEGKYYVHLSGIIFHIDGSLEVETI